MANIKSQIKRIKTNEIARQRNKATKSALRTSIRRFREAADAGDAAKATELAQVATRALDKAVVQGRHPQEPGGQPQVGDRLQGRAYLIAPLRGARFDAPDRSAFLPRSRTKSVFAR